MNTNGKLILFFLFFVTMIASTIILGVVSLFSPIETVKVFTWGASILGLLFIGFTGLMAEKSTAAKK
ncbi:hypothetical protein [Flammeovirga kamogawensis]|uniref:Uncharacterized protein n=1 Tax=Flammeovirga kamogawensis TaxID=373891 RepID=A0ABX8GUR9_9BACT|nr:hypothetical protein [Flammeovirga kamogawensis]MBB6459783.1 hypothetical protein [Flammeovirga kamogawensis]QWG07159.1 hypothetical protein KM029_17935 [Flammeovirga kamogawensis]TRX68981.1 hypothetical protein EO216_12925 [Flammeovirga kamogawensis]